MFSTDDSVAYRVIFEGKIKKIGKIYPDFPLVVKTDFLPNYEMVDRFLDKELFNESFFTFAEGLVKKEIDVSSYRLFYNRGEKTAFSRSPYMWILVYADKAALIRTGYISQRTREEPFIGAKYWICNFDNSDIQETKFVNCKKGKNVPSLIRPLFLWLVKLKMMTSPTLFVPTLPRVKFFVIQKVPIILELKVINFIFANNNAEGRKRFPRKPDSKKVAQFVQ